MKIRRAAQSRQCTEESSVNGFGPKSKARSLRFCQNGYAPRCLLLSIVWLSFALESNCFVAEPSFPAFRLSQRSSAHDSLSRPDFADWYNKTFFSKQSRRKRDIRFLSPLLEYGYAPAVEEFENKTLKDKPLLLYLPGFDGTFLSPFIQFPELHTVFDVRCMNVGPEDRSSLDDLREAVIDFLREETKREGHNMDAAVDGKNQSLTTPNNTTEPQEKGNFWLKMIGLGSDSKPAQPPRPRSVYLAGESFGGILACDVALNLTSSISNPKNKSAISRNNGFVLKGLTLINAATCYDRSALNAAGPSVAEMAPWLYPTLGIARLLPLFADEYSVDQLLLILQGKALPSVIDDETREAYMGRVAFSLPFVIPFLSQRTLWWRLNEWLEMGCARMANRLSDFQSGQSKFLKVLIVAGEKDATLPSIAEAERLASIFGNAIVHVVEGAGHASTCGSRVDLAALFRNRFPELRKPTTNNKDDNVKEVDGGWFRSKKKPEPQRIAMKADAAKGTGPYFGLQPRYDNKTIGLSPLKYWDAKYYRKWNP